MSVLDEPWGARKVYELFFGRSMPDSEAGDRFRDEGCRSWYQLRCAAVDYGRPELVLDAIQLEEAIDSLGDHRVRAAVWLFLAGFDEREIGQMLDLGGRSASGVLRMAVSLIVEFEAERLGG